MLRASLAVVAFLALCVSCGWAYMEWFVRHGDLWGWYIREQEKLRGETDD